MSYETIREFLGTERNELREALRESMLGLNRAVRYAVRYDGAVDVTRSVAEPQTKYTGSNVARSAGHLEGIAARVA